MLVGLSIDGPRELHDAYRHDGAGRSVFDQVEAAARLLQKHGAEFNVLCTINAANADASARRLPLLPRRARRALPAVHPDRRGRDPAGRRRRRHRDRPQRRRRSPTASSSRRSSTSGCATTWARCSCSSSTACSRPTCAATRRCACCARRAARASRSSTTATCTRATTSWTRRTCSATSWRRRSASSCAVGAAAGVRRGEARHAAALLPRVRVPLRVQRRVPEEPHPAHARRRAGPQLAVRGAQALLRAHRPAHEDDGRAAPSRGARPATSCRCSPRRPRAPGATTPARAAAAASTRRAAAAELR